MYRNKIYIFVIFPSLITISGCASNPGELRSFSPLSPPTDTPVIHKIRGVSLEEMCINKIKEDGASVPVCKESVLYEDRITTLGNAFGECLSDDTRCKSDRNNFIDLAVKIADNNCNEFRERIFAKRAGANIVTGVIRDSMNVGGAATAFGSPATSVGMSLGGLLIGSYDKTTQELFSNKTAQVFDKAIEQSMTSYYRDHLEKLCITPPYGACTINRAVNLVKQYTSMCSIRAALLTIEQSLQANKDVKETAAETAKQITDTIVASKVNTAVDLKTSSLSTTISTAGTDAATAKTDAATAKTDAATAIETATQANQVLNNLCNALKQSSDEKLKAALTGC